MAEAVNQLLDGIVKCREQRMYQNLVISDILNDLCTCMVVMHENLQVKYDALIDAVDGGAPMENAICDKNDISCMVDPSFIVDCQMETAGNDPDNLILCMPVIGHMITWAAWLFMVKSDRKIKCTMFALLFIVYVFHESSLSNE